MDKKLKIKLLGQDYTVSFPNVGQILDIESLKSALTNGTYGDLVKMNTKSSNFALDLTDTIATFSVLIPDLSTVADIKSYHELDQVTAIKLIAAYRDTFFPWFNEINKGLQEYGVKK